MGWGEPHGPLIGTGTTEQIALAQEALAAVGIDQPSLAQAAIAAAGAIERLTKERDGVRAFASRMAHEKAEQQSRAALLENLNADLKEQVQRSLHWQAEAERLRTAPA